MKLYVLVRKDLKPSYSAVQAGHALAEYLIKKPDTQWKNGVLVYLGVKNEAALCKWTHKLDLKGFEWVGFWEPDLDNQLTAIASVVDSNVFSKLKLF